MLPHIKHVATLPCGISVVYYSQNNHAQEVIEANCHVKLSHSQIVLKYLPVKNKHYLV